MTDKALLEAARQKLRAAKAASSPTTAKGSGGSQDQILDAARQKLRAAKALSNPEPTSPSAAGGAPSPAPLPRLKGDARPVEPVAGVSAVAPKAEAPAPSVPATQEPGMLDTLSEYVPQGLSSMFKKAALLNPVTAPMAIGNAIGSTVGEVGTTPYKRSAQRFISDIEGGKALVGAGDAAAFVEEKKQLDAIQYDADLALRIKGYGDTDGFAQGIQYLYNNPDVFTAMMGEQAANMGISVGASAAGAGAGSLAGPVGTVAGLTTGAFAASGVSRAMEAVTEFMEFKDIDPTNEAQVRGLFENPVAMREMREYAAKTGVVVGAMDALTGLLGAKGAGAMLAKPLVKPFTKAAPGPVSEVAANTAIDALGGGAGELGGMAWRGDINLNDVRDEVIFGTAAGLGTATVETVVARKERSSRPPTPEEIAAAAGVPYEPPEVFVTPEEAEAEGRTLFGFAENEKDGPVEVGTYEEAERKAGAGDIRRGKIIAVKEDEAGAAVTVDEVVQAVEADPTQTQLPQITKRLDTFYGKRGQDASLKIMQAIKTFDTETLVKKLDATVALENLKAAVGTALQPLRSYSGERKGRGVSPAVRNEVPVTAVTSGMSGGLRIEFVKRGNQSKKLNLDSLQKKLQEKNWTIVPAGIKKIIGQDIRLGKLLDNTFTFTKPEVRQQFIDGDLDQRTALMKSGDVKWTGKLDSRFLATSDATMSADAKLAILREDGSLVNDAEAVSLVRGLVEKGLGTDAVPATQTYGRQWDSTSVYSEESIPEFDKVFAGGATSKHYTVNTKFDIFSKIFQKLHDKFRIKTRTIYVEATRPYSGGALTFPSQLALDMPKTLAVIKAAGDYNGVHIDITTNARVIVLVTDLGNPRSDADMYGTLTHEMGHALASEHFANAPLEVRNKIFAAYRRFILANPVTPQQFDQLQRRRFAAAKRNYGFQFVDQNQRYFLSFEEWFAEQTAMWGDTNSRPLGVLGRFFRSLAKQIVALYKTVRQIEGKLESRPELEMEQFLNSVWDGADVLTNWPQNAVQYTEAQGRAASAKVSTDTLPQHQTAANVAAVLKSVMNQPFMPPTQKAMLQSVMHGVDRYGWFSEWALNLRQLAARNPHIQELQLVNELFDFAKNDATRIMVEGEGYLKRWRQRSKKQQDALNDLLFEMNDMSYLQPNEAARWPTAAEFAAMVQRLGLDADTLVLYRDIRDFFLNSVRRQEELQIAEAMRITDPVLQAAAIKSAQDMSRNMIASPYFPQMRFGKWALTIRDANGHTEEFITFQTKKQLAAAAREAALQYPASAGWVVNASSIPTEVQPFMGVPGWMLDKLRDMPGMSPQQQDWLESFRYMLAPATSFRKRLMRRKNIKGFSTDGRRTFANYAFHHARFYARIKHDWDLRTAIDGLRKSNNPGLDLGEVQVRVEMADFVERIYKEFRNPSQDWAQLRILNAIWHLAYVPASAIVNMTQTVLATAPYLSAKFGNVKGEAALMNAARKLSTYYKQGSYAGIPDSEFKAIAKAVEDGHIDESMAAELAAMAVGSGSGLTSGSSFVKEKLAVGWQQFTEKGMWMFRMAEQWNRRVSFRAARQLAYDNPAVPYVQNMRTKYFLQYDALMKSGWTDREAISYLVGVDTLKETHYTYDRLARPRFMQGRKSVLFAFYMFTQNSLFMLWNNKDMLARYMLYMAILAGPMGLVPEDAEEVINAIARQLYGKDFNLEREARKFVTELLDDDSNIPPDLLLHGASRYSFGLAKAGEMLGAKFVPDIDMSKNLTLSRIMPLNVTSLLKPAADWNERVARMTQDAAGAAYGIPLSISKAIMGSDLDIADFKRWEGAMPRAFRATTRALRVGIEGGERNNQMARTIPYQYEDPKELAELVAMAAGFTPTKQSQYWDRQMGEKELDVFWKAQKTELYEELFQSRFIYDDKEAFSKGMDKVREFNKRAPTGYAITTQGLKNSLKQRELRRRQVESGDNPYVQRGVEDEIQRLYPEGSVTQQKVVQ